MSKNLFQVDILDVNTLGKTGVRKSAAEAFRTGDWIGSFNLWVVQRHPVPSIVYQQRRIDSHWAPGLLDVSAGGRYYAGESIQDGLREVREELGKDYLFDTLTHLGTKVYMKDEPDGRRLRYIVDVFLREDNTDLKTFTVSPDELQGLFVCPVSDLIRVHQDELASFKAKGIQFQNGELVETSILVSSASFPYNWDNYHFKMALLCKRYFAEDFPLIY